MIAFVFDRRSLVLLGTGAVFLALVLVAVGFLLGVQYGVLPPAAPQSTTAQANPSALPTRVTGMADDAIVAAPDSGLGNSDAEPIEGEGAVGFLDRSAPESLPYVDAPAGEGSAIDEQTPAFSASPPAWPPQETAETGRSRTAAAAPRFDPPADPIVDSRGGEPVPLAPSPQSVPDRPSQDSEPQADNEAPSAPTAITAAVGSDSGRFAVQVGAYRERLNCDAMVQKLTTRGFEPYVVEIVRDGKSPLYAVRVGRFGERGAAAKAASALRSKAGVSVVVLSIG